MNLWSLSPKIASFFMSIAMFFASLFPFMNSADFSIDTTNKLYEVKNVVNTLNCWDPYEFDENTRPDGENDVISFVRYIELMRATGGNENDDPFVEPLDRTVLDDYDFSRIIASCRGILNLGAKPFIKLGNVPLKLSDDPIIGSMNSNVRPPADYDEWYRFLIAYLGALIDNFGLDEVKTWRFGVFTEYENDDWFYAGDKDPEASFVEYCKIYDYSVKALTDKLGDDVYVGAHSMTVIEGLWDERDFIAHCANGTNYATGEKGTHISYLSSSFYDSKINEKTSGMRPAECIEFLRGCAESVGLYGLDYGFDEGRILTGNYGQDAEALVPRAVGWNIQSAYDAKLYKEISEAGADRFSSWGYTSGGSVNGYPSVAYHTAERFSKFAGASAVSVESKTNGSKKNEKGSFASYDKENGVINIMAYNFKESYNYFTPSKMSFKINAPDFDGKKIEIKTYRIDSDCNFFDEWQSDARKYIKDKTAMSWSPDAYTLDGNILSDELREKYENELRDKYVECSALDFTSEETECRGEIDLSLFVEANTSVFIVITAK